MGEPKRCATCKIPKPRDEFWKNRSQPDGLQNSCKPCLYATQKRCPSQRRGYVQPGHEAEHEARQQRRREREQRALEVAERRRERARIQEVTTTINPPIGRIRCVGCSEVKATDLFPPSCLRPDVPSRRCEDCWQKLERS